MFVGLQLRRDNDSAFLSLSPAALCRCALARRFLSPPASLAPPARPVLSHALRRPVAGAAGAGPRSSTGPRRRSFARGHKQHNGERGGTTDGTIAAHPLTRSLCCAVCRAVLHSDLRCAACCCAAVRGWRRGDAVVQQSRTLSQSARNIRVHIAAMVTQPHTHTDADTTESANDPTAAAPLSPSSPRRAVLVRCVSVAVSSQVHSRRHEGASIQVAQPRRDSRG